MDIEKFIIEKSAERRKTEIEKSARYGYYLNSILNGKDSVDALDELRNDSFFNDDEKDALLKRAVKSVTSNFLGLIRNMDTIEISSSMKSLLSSTMISEDAKINVLKSVRNSLLLKVHQGMIFEKILNCALFFEHEKTELIFNLDIIRNKHTDIKAFALRFSHNLTIENYGDLFKEIK